MSTVFKECNFIKAEARSTIKWKRGLMKKNTNLTRKIWFLPPLKRHLTFKSHYYLCIIIIVPNVSRSKTSYDQNLKKKDKQTTAHTHTPGSKRSSFRGICKYYLCMLPQNLCIYMPALSVSEHDNDHNYNANP